MAILLNHQLREYVPHNSIEFPITYFYDELVALPDWAGRCFHTYMGCSPIEALIQYRLQVAYRLLSDRTQTLQQISYVCGFNSVNYFSRQFKKKLLFKVEGNHYVKTKELQKNLNSMLSWLCYPSNIC